MKSIDQMQMFEPEGKKLAELVGAHKRNADFEFKRAENLRTAGYTASAAHCFESANGFMDSAAVCEMAYQVECLAGLV